MTIHQRFFFSIFGDGHPDDDDSGNGGEYSRFERRWYYRHPPISNERHSVNFPDFMDCLICLFRISIGCFVYIGHCYSVNLQLDKMVMDKHLSILAKEHIETRFVKIQVEKSPLLAESPTLAFIKNTKVDDHNKQE
ncbi:hypothetical protein AALP_AA8G141900 [Arabis alpina]|uniref:Uncharacterized protein n=1 Tax=Arabis alpina TaxID=50452 RepID=A0A087G6Z5_ARAAL|nr:hypothetical protein AALP_AA8G141900 [Arabis alpina]